MAAKGKTAADCAEPVCETKSEMFAQMLKMQGVKPGGAAGAQAAAAPSAARGSAATRREGEAEGHIGRCTEHRCYFNS